MHRATVPHAVRIGGGSGGSIVAFPESDRVSAGQPMARRASWRFVVVIAGLALAVPRCSVRKLAIDRIGDALANSGSAYARDDDPELVREAVPFALKTIESLLDESPRHRGLLLAAARGFTQYAFAFVQQDADLAEAVELQRAQELRTRAKKLYLRARGHGFRGLELSAPGFADSVRSNPGVVLARLGRRDVPLLYWTAMAWGGAISLAKDDTELTADLEVVERLMHRALDLDEAYDGGAIHDFYIAWEGGRPAAAGGSVEKAKRHFDRALELAQGTRAAPFVIYAESVSVATQKREEFRQLLEKALEVDADRVPERRLENLVMQKRARWLLARTDELFLE